MAASMKGMLRVLFKNQGMQTNGLNVFVIMRFQRMLATVTKYQTSVDDSLSETTSFRKHPGIIRPKPVILPDALQQNINRYLADKPTKQLKRHATAMANYLWCRHRPLEESDLRMKAQEYASLEGVADIDEEMLQSKDVPKEKKKKVASVMNTLRRHVYHWQPITYDESTVCAYTISRVAPNYATTYRVLHEIKKRMPDFNPEALLDFGSGVGTSTWAAHSLWSDSLKEFYCVDTSKSMHDVAESLMRGESADDEANKTLIKGVYLRHFLPVSIQKKYDLTISAFSLLELPRRADRLNILRTLWHKTDHFLILIESGTNEGYQTILEARDFILNELRREAETRTQQQSVAGEVTRGELGLVEDPVSVVGHVFAPCQHDFVCPRSTDASVTPCNFEQDFHNFTKKGLSSELITERFCYMVLRKGPRMSGDNNDHWPRIVRPVLTRSRHVICRLCCSNGQLQETVITKAKHGRELYRCARYAKWGDLLPISKPQDSSALESTSDRTDNDHTETDVDH